MEKIEREIRIDGDKLVLELSIRGCQDIYYAYLKRMVDVDTEDIPFVDLMNLIYHHGFRQDF